MVTPNYTQAQVLTVEGDPSEVAVGDAGRDTTPIDKQRTTPPGMYNPNVCWRCGQVGHFTRDYPNKDPQPMRALGKLHHTWEAETPVTRSLLNEFFNKLMQSERQQEIAKAKLKKVRQQLNALANTNQTAGGATPKKPIPLSSGPPAVTPPPANVPRKAQVGRPAQVRRPAQMGRPARVAKPKVPPQAAVLGPKKPAPLKLPATRHQTKNQVAPKIVAVTDPEGDRTAPMDAEYDTDELAELPTDSESELVESEPGEEVVQNEEQ